MRRIYIIPLVLVILVLLPGNTLGPAYALETAKTLIISGDDWGYPSPFSFYPRGPGYIRMSWIFDTLTWKDENGVIPWLADKWTVSEDGKMWIFKLHHGVKWHDGKPFTARDVKFSFDYIREQVSSFQWFANLKEIDKVEVRDEYTAVIYLKKSIAPFLVDIAGNVPIIPEHIWKGIREPQKFLDKEAVMGTGPFKLVNYSKERGTYIYEANKDFFKGKTLIDRLVSIKAGDTALALKTGTIDAGFFWGKEIDAVKELQKEPNLKNISGPSFWVLQIIFNGEKFPLDRKDFRKAVAYAIDRQEIVNKVIHKGAVVASPGVIHPETNWYNPYLPKYGFDPKKAKKMLDSLNFMDRDGDGIRETESGEKLEFILFTTGRFTREAEIIRDNLRGLGIRVEIKASDWSTIDGLLREKRFDVVISGHGGIANPNILRNVSWPASTYKNAEYDTIFKRQEKTLDLEKRKELVFKLQSMIAENLPVFCLYHPRIWCVYNPKKLNSWFYTKNGVAIGIPTETNKLVFIR